MYTVACREKEEVVTEEVTRKWCKVIPLGFRSDTGETNTEVTYKDVNPICNTVGTVACR